MIPVEAQGKLRKAAQPEWMTPMLATLTEDRFSDPDWLFERKLDGVRCLIFRRKNRVRLFSRNHHDLNGHYPELVEALDAQPGDDFIADGEIVAFDGNNTSFAKLQRRLQVSDPEAARRTGVRVFLYLFDVPHLDGHDLTALELRHRKSVLRRMLTFRDPLRFTTHRIGAGVDYWQQACGRGWEGVIAKRADSPYVHGRSPDWLKFKCVNEQEFVIGGYTDPKGSRVGFGALLIGYYDNGELRYAGKVGTGYDDHTLEQLGDRLARSERTEPAFAHGKLPRAGVHWVEPELVAQVGFTEWTRDGQLRHPRFRGLRDDKSPRDVVRERAR
ncbi:ATP-dependent DNA ligase [Kribbella pittospori]|uniref:DNA ligase (ATP) n=1 Tax=Kribbella pittospori TaxID=722689 RepID=A0A4R0KE29_9ACTN|nr:non-homologous end-joining DNA ligase [Kribbella pittospori]TCC57747.1 ATP-dependent DNA ligase [Kribbella pittospori]